MALFIVVHHPAAPHQSWANDWENETLLRAITTPKGVAARLARAKETGERVFVHRCAYGDRPAEICCSVAVADTRELDKSTAFVRFAEVRREGAVPPVEAHIGQSSYEAVFP
jgi:hypothetical protein